MTYQDFIKLSERELDECCALVDGYQRPIKPLNCNMVYIDPEGYWTNGIPNYLDPDGLAVHGLRLAKKAVEKDAVRFATEIRLAIGKSSFIHTATAFVSEPKAVLYAAINALASTSGVREE